MSYMGYDMHMVEQDTSKDDEHSQAELDFRNAVAQRGLADKEGYAAAQKRVEEAYERVSNTDINYFRLNIWGMQQMRESLSKLGMLAHEYETPPWPTLEDFGVTEEEWEAAEDGEAEGVNEGVEKYKNANLAHRSWSPPDEPGLPLHKFCSNDGWIVTPLDCEAALRIYEKRQAEDPDVVDAVRAEWTNEDGSNYFDEWIEYLARAQRLSGFEVW